MTLALLILISADVIVGAIPPIKTCDEAAYLPQPTPPMPPPLPPPPVRLIEFIGPFPINAPMPTGGRASDTYSEHLRRFEAQPMRRRSQ